MDHATPRTAPARGLPEPRLVLGGTPTFPIHAALDALGIECSPGTCTLHDFGYATRYPDLPFEPAAVLLSRVISHPCPDRLCLDLGHKAVAADPPRARVSLLDVPDATLGGQSEEHLVVETPHAHRFPPAPPSWRCRSTFARPAPCTAASTSSRAETWSMSGRSPPVTGSFISEGLFASISAGEPAPFRAMEGDFLGMVRNLSPFVG